MKNLKTEKKLRERQRNIENAIRAQKIIDDCKLDLNKMREEKLPGYFTNITDEILVKENK